MKPGDWVLLQNETCLIPECIKAAKEKGLKVAYNPAPISDSVREYPLNLVDLIFVNEVEGKELTGSSSHNEIVSNLNRDYPNLGVVLTLGEKGVIYADKSESISLPAFRVEAVDTTAAGDTFIGYFLASKLNGLPTRECLEIASKAAAICVTSRGAASSIPELRVVKEYQF